MAKEWSLESGLRAEAIEDEGGDVTGVKVIGNTRQACKFLKRLNDCTTRTPMFTCGAGSIIMVSGRKHARVPIPPTENHLATDIAIALFEGGLATGEVAYSYDGHTEAVISLA
jgi:hypothetical protein